MRPKLAEAIRLIDGPHKRRDLKAIRFVHGSGTYSLPDALSTIDDLIEDGSSSAARGLLRSLTQALFRDVPERSMDLHADEDGTQATRIAEINALMGAVANIVFNIRLPNPKEEQLKEPELERLAGPRWGTPHAHGTTRCEGRPLSLARGTLPPRPRAGALPTKNGHGQ